MRHGNRTIYIEGTSEAKWRLEGSKNERERVMSDELSFGVWFTSGKNGEKLKWLEPVFHGWRNIIYQSVQIFPDDPAYWYEERPQVSLLASGAWLCPNFVALQEYSTEKSRSGDDTNSGGDIKKGRTDLYLCDTENELEMEAKYSYVQFDTEFRSLAATLENAVSAAAENQQTDLHVGAAFYIVQLRGGGKSKREERCRNKREERCRKLIAYCREKLDDERLGADAVTWCFPPEMADREHKLEDGIWYYPGLIAAFKIAKKKR